MTVTIRDADLKRDRNELIRFLSENLSAAPNAARFDWLYLENPYGRARAWMALNDSGETVGVAAAFPRHFSVAGKATQVWVLGDFCIAPQYRTLGPAVSLQRASLESLGTSEAVVCYDFPSQNMLSIYRRLGIPTLGQHIRYAKVLRSEEKVRKYVRNTMLAGPLIQIGNWTLARGLLSHSHSHDITFSLQENEFGEEFDVIDSAAASHHAVRGLRNAQYLNWRYIRHPLKSYCVVTARRKSKLVGYAVVEAGGPHAMLADVRTTDAENTVPGLLAHAETVARNMGAQSINASAFESCYLVAYLRSARFHPRESAAVVACTSIQDSGDWLLFDGDRDS
jgi:hypothetical protein